MTPPYAKLQYRINGGTLQTGGQVVAGGVSIQMTAESKVGWGSARWEIFDFPDGYPTPSGWSYDSTNRKYYFVGVDNPPAFTVSAAAVRWGPYGMRLIVDDGTPNGLGDPRTDETSAVRVESSTGLSDLMLYEEAQFGGSPLQWLATFRSTLRAIDARLTASGAGFGKLFSVLDYGAHADGSTDLGAALQDAGDDALQNYGGGQIVIPPDPDNPGGFYNMTTPVTFDYSNAGLGLPAWSAGLRITGAAGGAPIRIANSFSNVQNAIQISNSDHYSIVEYLTFFPQTQATVNLASCIKLASGLGATIRHCQAFGLGFSQAPYWAQNGLNVHFQDCKAHATTCTSATGAGLILVSDQRYGVVIERCEVIDLGAFGPTMGWTSLSQSVNGILVLVGNTTAYGEVLGFFRPVKIEQCDVDEGYGRNISVIGDSSIKIPWVEIVGCNGNLGGAPGTYESVGVYLEHVRHAEVRMSAGSYTTLPSTPAVMMKDVDVAAVRHERVGPNPANVAVGTPGADADRIVADQDCGEVTVEHQRGFAFIDSRARVTNIVEEGKLTVVRRPASGGYPVVAEREEGIVLAAVGGSGGTATRKEIVDHGSELEIIAQVTAGKSAVVSGTVSASISAYRATRSVVASHRGGVAALAAASGGAANPTTTSANDVADTAFGSSSSAYSIGTSGDDDKAILTVTNQHTSAVDYFVKQYSKRSWPAFDPSLWARLFSTLRVGLWLHDGIAQSAGNVTGAKDFSGNHLDLSVGAVAPVYAASVGPNSLPAMQFTGTQQMVRSFASTTKQATMCWVGTFTTNAETMAALSAATGSYGTGMELATETNGGNDYEVARVGTSTSFYGSQTLVTGTFKTRTVGLYKNEQWIYSETTRGTTFTGAPLPDDCDELSIGMRPGGTRQLTGYVQAGFYIDKFLPSNQYANDAGALVSQIIGFFRTMYGTT